MDAELPSLPVGRSGRLNVVGLTNATGSHALLVRHDEESRALITGEPVRGHPERLIVVPFDEDVELRIDGDALAIWLAQGSVGRTGGSRVPAWANALGYLLVLLVILFLVVGGVTVFSWLFALGGAH